MKLDAVNKELKGALENYKNSKGNMKASAKLRCINLMKKKKMYESHVGTLESTQFNVENVHLQTQMMKDNIAIVKNKISHYFFNFSSNFFNIFNKFRFRV